MNITALPALRNIEAVPVEQDGEQVIVLYDPEHYVSGQIMLSGPAFFVAAHLNGENTMDDVRRAFSNYFGNAPIAEEQVQQIVSFLDEQGFLLTGRFEALQTRVAAEYAEAPLRPAALAGASYPEEPEELKAYLDAFLGPLPEAAVTATPLAGLVAPHIDFNRGGACYGAGYRRMAEAGAPDTVVIFGVAHNPPPVPFVLSRKGFDTPLGALALDQELSALLSEACFWDPYAFEIAHRTEHSIEFQAVMIARLFGERVRIVPVLCAQFPDDGDHEGWDAVNAFLRVLHEEVAKPEKRIAVVAGADWAHVGRRFGDAFDIDAEVEASVRARDNEDLAFALKPDAAAFHASVEKDGNARRVCGSKAIYATLQALDGVAAPGVLLDYGQAPDPAGGLVSFAAIALARR